MDLDRKIATFRNTKNGEHRSVPLSDALSERLWKERRLRNTISEYVFPSCDGSQPADIREAWENAVAKAGLAGICFHTLRHTVASHLTMGGASAIEVGAILGHKTLAMVKRYSHLSVTIKQSHQSLFSTPHGIELFLKRGFSVKMMKEYQVGWNPHNLWISRELWGLESIEGKKLWIPKGLVLPTFDLDTGEPIKLKIRRDDWESNIELPKYIEICGGMQTPSRFGIVKNKPIMIVESEFDAMLVQKFAGDLVGCMALGGASKRPDAQAHRILSTQQELLPINGGVRCILI